MKLVNLTCPNCAGPLERVGDNLYCKLCGGAFAIDYDDADVEHEKFQTEEERAQRDFQYEQERERQKFEMEEERKRLEFEHQRQIMEMKYRQEEEARIAAEKRQVKRARKDRFSRAVRARISGLIALAILIGFFYGSYRLMVASGVMPKMKDMLESATATSADPYDVSAGDIPADVLEGMIAAGQNAKVSTRSNGVTDLVNNEWIDYTLVSAEYDSSYFIAGASTGRNRVVIIYKLTWSSSIGEKVTYDASYFDGLRKDANGSILTDYDPDTISRGSASWHYDSYEDRDQCYRENVSAFGGTVSELTRGEDGASAATVDPEATETAG